MGILHVKSNTIADFTGTVTVNNHSGGTNTVAATDLVRPSDWNSGHNQFFSVGGNTLSASTASGADIHFAASGPLSIGVSGGNTIFVSAAERKTLDGFIPDWFHGSRGLTDRGQGSLCFHPINVQDAFKFDCYVQEGYYSCATNTSNSGSVNLHVGIYTRNGSTLSLLSSTSKQFAVTNSGTEGSYSRVSGVRLYPIEWTGTLTEGNYWLCQMSITSKNAGGNLTFNNVVASNWGSYVIGHWQSVATQTLHAILGQGIGDATSAAMPAAIQFNSIIGQGALLQRPVIAHFASTI